jgi:hypothetical protein
MKIFPSLACKAFPINTLARIGGALGVKTKRPARGKGSRLASSAEDCYCRFTGEHMSTVTFDTLSFARKLQALGFTKEQAEGFAQLQRELIDERLATKADIVAAKNELQQQIKDLEYRLTIRLGGMMAASVAIVAALVKLT